MKKCNVCGEVKPRSEYYAHKKMADGLLGKCKACHKEAMVVNRANKTDYYRAYDAWRFKNDPKVRIRHLKYQATDRGKDVNNRLKREYIANNPDKHAAHVLVNNAVKNGRLFKPTNCPICGEFKPSRQIHAHHDDYTKPLQVRWMCSACHRKEHYGE